MGIEVMTERARAAFVHVYQPKANAQGTKRHYKLAAIWPSWDAVKGLQAAIEQAAKEKWGEKAAGILASPKFKNPLKDQGEFEKDGKIYEGFTPGLPGANIQTDADRNPPPGVVDENGQRLTLPSDFRSGDYFRAKVDVYAWDNPEGGKGASIDLIHIQRWGRGDPLGGARPETNPEDEFKPIEGFDAGEQESVL